MRLDYSFFKAIKCEDGKTRLIPRHHCKWCWAPVNPGTDTCEDCLSGRPLNIANVARMIAPTIYLPKKDNVLQNYFQSDEILEMKNNHHHGAYARLTTNRLSSFFNNHADINYLVVPIPPRIGCENDHHIHNFAKEISRCVPNSKYVELLNYNRPMESQKGLNKTERFSNKSGSMSITEEIDCQEKVVFIVDDIVTTGSTMREAARAMGDLKPSAICCLAAARSTSITYLKRTGAIIDD